MREQGLQGTAIAPVANCYTGLSWGALLLAKQRQLPAIFLGSGSLPLLHVALQTASSYMQHRARISKMKGNQLLGPARDPGPSSWERQLPKAYAWLWSQVLLIVLLVPRQHGRMRPAALSHLQQGWAVLAHGVTGAGGFIVV